MASEHGSSWSALPLPPLSLATRPPPPRGPHARLECRHRGLLWLATAHRRRTPAHTLASSMPSSSSRVLGTTDFASLRGVGWW
jgi:hypothetical protein